MQILRWSDQGASARLLRVWLGATFLYAGVQKLADPGFLREGSRTYIGTQLDGFASNSPIGGLLDLVSGAPVAIGIAIAVTEILVGVATLAGTLPAIAALVGAALSLTLWLSASWNVYPYYLGSDSIYLVAWVAYLLALPATAAAITALRERRLPGPVRADDPSAAADSRRHVLRGAAVIGGSLAVAGLAGLRGRTRDAGTASGASRPVPTTTGGAPTSSASASAPSTGGSVVTDLATLDRDGSAEFTDPAVGDAVVVAVPGSAPVAFSTRCTHSGCTVSYDSTSRLLNCPCHGSQFDPADGGAAVQGPATRALDPVPVVVDEAAGVVRRA